MRPSISTAVVLGAAILSTGVLGCEHCTSTDNEGLGYDISTGFQRGSDVCPKEYEAMTGSSPANNNIPLPDDEDRSYLPGEDPSSTVIHNRAPQQMVKGDDSKEEDKQVDSQSSGGSQSNGDSKPSDESQSNGESKPSGDSQSSGESSVSSGAQNGGSGSTESTGAQNASSGETQSSSGSTESPDHSEQDSTTAAAPEIKAESNDSSSPVADEKIPAAAASLLGDLLGTDLPYPDDKSLSSIEDELLSKAIPTDANQRSSVLSIIEDALPTGIKEKESFVMSLTSEFAAATDGALFSSELSKVLGDLTSTGKKEDKMPTETGSADKPDGGKVEVKGKEANGAAKESGAKDKESEASGGRQATAAALIFGAAVAVAGMIAW